MPLLPTSLCSIDSIEKLTALALQSGHINSVDCVQIESEFMDVFTEIMHRYTLGESDTLKVETAEKLIQSILYTINLYLQHLDSPESALEDFQHSFRTLYTKALSYAENFVKDTFALYKSIESERIPSANKIYTETFENDLPEFFSSYHLVFEAQNTVCSMDYPLYFDDMRIEGIQYMRNYLETFKLENEFCKFSGPTLINILLREYGKMNRINYEEFPVNLFDICLTQFFFFYLCATIFKTKPNTLFFNAQRLDQVIEHFSSHSIKVLETTLLQCTDLLIKDLNLESNTPLASYTLKACSSLSQRFSIAIKNKTLENIIIHTKTHTEPSANYIVYTQECTLSNQDFSQLYSKLLRSSNISDKIALLKSSISSMTDFIDLLKAECFTPEECTKLYKTLSIDQIATLVKWVCNDTHCHSVDHFKRIIIQTQNASQNLWELQFTQWILSLPNTDINSLIDCLKTIEDNEII